MPGYYILVDELAAAMVDIAVNGAKGDFVENEELRSRGRKVLGL